MSFDNLHDFLYMGGHYAFVWSAYGSGVVGIVLILVRPLRARRKFFAEQAQRLARQARGRVTRGNGDNEVRHACPFGGSLSKNAIQNASGNCAFTGTEKNALSAKARHFTASFSVISTGRRLPNSKSAGAYA